MEESGSGACGAPGPWGGAAGDPQMTHGSVGGGPVGAPKGIRAQEDWAQAISIPARLARRILAVAVLGHARLGLSQDGYGQTR